MTVLSTLLRNVLLRPKKEAGRVEFDVPSALAEAAECLRSGRSGQAHALCSDVLDHEPANVLGHHLLGTVLAQRGEYELATQSLRRALALDLRRVDAWVDLASVLRLCDERDESLACYRRALEIDSRHVLAAYGESQLLVQIGCENEAINKLQERIVLDYDPLLLRTLVALLAKHGEVDTAKRLCEQALATNAEHAEAHSGAGFLALTSEQDPAGALVHFDQAVASLGADCDLLSNRGIALQELGSIDEAIVCYEKALSIDPQHRSARIHRALALLMQADYERGWREYEYRRLGNDWATPPNGVPEWQGEDLRGKSIYVYAEQGIGDEILFASCIPDLLGCARKVMVECDPRLMPIFVRSFPRITVYDRAQRLTGSQSPARVGADFMVPIASLPRYFRTHPQAFPDRRGYLCADDELVAPMRARLAELPEPLKVGISWRGGTAKTWRSKRSIALDDLLSLLQTPGIAWVSVQYGDTREELAHLLAHDGIHVHEFPDVLAEFDQTAALACALDLVISVDTAIANLCGALGQRTWVAVASSPDWRYGLHSESTPWYSSMRLFRQTVNGEWENVIAAVKSQLLAFGQKQPEYSANVEN